MEEVVPKAAESAEEPDKQPEQLDKQEVKALVDQAVKEVRIKKKIGSPVEASDLYRRLPSGTIVRTQPKRREGRVIQPSGPSQPPKTRAMKKYLKKLNKA